MFGKQRGIPRTMNGYDNITREEQVRFTEESVSEIMDNREKPQKEPVLGLPKKKKPEFRFQKS